MNRRWFVFGSAAAAGALAAAAVPKTEPQATPSKRPLRPVNGPPDYGLDLIQGEGEESMMLGLAPIKAEGTRVKWEA
jgi:hypothetical protein